MRIEIALPVDVKQQKQNFSVDSIRVFGTRVLDYGRLEVSRTWRSTIRLRRRGSEPDGLSSLGQRSFEVVNHHCRMMAQKCRNVGTKKLWPLMFLVVIYYELKQSWEMKLRCANLLVGVAQIESCSSPREMQGNILQNVLRIYGAGHRQTMKDTGLSSALLNGIKPYSNHKWQMIEQQLISVITLQILQL